MSNWEQAMMLKAREEVFRRTKTSRESHFRDEEELDLVMSLRVSTLHKENFLTNQIKSFLDDASIKGGECNLILILRGQEIGARSGVNFAICLMEKSQFPWFERQAFVLP
jgi:hypothetical protein